MLQRHARLLILTLLVALSACGGPYQFHGTVLDPPNPAPDFTLTAHTGEPFSLSMLRGKVVLLFFGFASCPDICPTALGNLAEVQQQLGADAAHTQVVFVTLDPARDTPARLAAYVTAFDPSFLGLHGSEEQLEPILKAYGVTRIRRELPDSALQYTIDHSAYVYVIDQAGNWRELLQDGTPREDMSSDIRYFVRNGGS